MLSARLRAASCAARISEMWQTEELAYIILQCITLQTIRLLSLVPPVRYSFCRLLDWKTDVRGAVPLGSTPGTGVDVVQRQDTRALVFLFVIGWLLCRSSA